MHAHTRGKPKTKMPLTQRRKNKKVKSFCIAWYRHNISMLRRYVTKHFCCQNVTLWPWLFELKRSSCITRDVINPSIDFTDYGMAMRSWVVAAKTWPLLAIRLHMRGVTWHPSKRLTMCKFLKPLIRICPQVTPLISNVLTQTCPQTWVLPPNGSGTFCSKNCAALNMAITLSILDRFAKFFRCCKER